MMSMKWKGSYCSGSGRKCRSESEMTTFVWVQKAAYGSVCKLLHHCTQSAVMVIVLSHKPRKVREASVMSCSTNKTKQD